jgi:hypothetical protein
MPTSTLIGGFVAGVAFGPAVGSGLGVGTAGDNGFAARLPDCPCEMLPKTKVRPRRNRTAAMEVSFIMTIEFGKRPVL